MINRIVRLSHIDAAHRPLRLSWQTLQSRIYRSVTPFFRPSLILLHEIVLTHLNVCLMGRLSGKPLVEGVQGRNWSLIDASKLFLAGKLSSTNNWQFDLGREGASSFSKWSLSRLGCGPAETTPLCWHFIETIRKKAVFVLYLTLPIRSLIISSNFRIRKLIKMALVFVSKVLLKTILSNKPLIKSEQTFDILLIIWAADFRKL